MRLVTLNVRNTADRWAERRSLLARQLAALAPDVVALQELRTWPDQARWIVEAVERGSGGRLRYAVHRRPKAGPWGLWEGLAVLTRIPVAATASVGLGSHARVAQRVTVRVPGGGFLDVYNTHLAPAGETVRRAQAARLLAWVDARRPAVVAGDFNARPGSPTIELLSRRLRSAHAEVHGAEPARTVPTPLRGGATGGGSVLDYVFVSDGVDVLDARVVFDEVDAADPTLAASDHFGVSATLAVTGCCSPASPDRRRR